MSGILAPFDLVRYNKKRKQMINSEGQPINLLVAAPAGLPSLTETVEFKQAIEHELTDATGTTFLNLDRVLKSSGQLSAVPASSLLPANFFKLRRAIQKNLYNGTAPVKILCVGDSTTEGIGATGISAGGLTTTAGVGYWPVQLRNLLNKNIAPTSYTFGVPNETGSYTDSRFTYDAGWGYKNGTAAVGFGGAYAGASQGVTTNLTFNPGMSYDTVNIYYANSSANPTSVPVSINGVAQTPYNATTGPGGTGWGKASYTVTKTSGPIVITGGSGWTGGGMTYVMAIETYVAGTPEFQICNAGCGGSKTSDWLATNNGGIFNGKYGILSYQPDLTIIMLGINDARNSVATSTVQTNLTALITAAKTSGDVILMSTIPSDTSNGLALETDYRPMIKALAESQGCGFIDIFNRQVSYQTNNAKGWANDGIGHLKDAGYQDIANAVYDTIRAVMYGHAAV